MQPDPRAMAATLDTCGLLCPLPVLKARKRLGEMAPGQTLRVLSDDPASRIDFPHFCREQGHTLIETDTMAGNIFVFVILKGGQAQS